MVMSGKYQVKNQAQKEIDFLPRLEIKEDFETRERKLQESDSDKEKYKTLELIYTLCKTLQTEDISYCHWKSNNALDFSANGKNDLDLLVSRSEIQHFLEILYRLGFKKAECSDDQITPGIVNFYGYDGNSGQIVHVHAHYNLIMGHDDSKNYQIPVEQGYLESAEQGELFRVPAPEFELILFVIRMMLKHSTWDVILTRQGKLNKNERKELSFLQSFVNIDRLHEILHDHLPYLDQNLFDACLNSLQEGTPRFRRGVLGIRLQYAIRAFARRPKLIELTLKWRQRFVHIFRARILRRPLKKRFSRGGALIAIVGGDGAGKTTAIDELYAWLSDTFETKKTHLGKPNWSFITFMVRGFLKIGTILKLYPFETIMDNINEEGFYRFPGYPWFIREICTARDRVLSYTRARRFAANGGIVICDRFPLPQYINMDGPMSSLIRNHVNDRWFFRPLSRIEMKYYRFFIPPEILIVLRADPEIAVSRKKEEDEIFVRSRSSEIWEKDWSNTPAYVIDANQTKEAVLTELKNLVWSKL